jgi:phosphotriesterase-related protein
MSQVSTVRGPVDVADLGPTYMHEHIFVLTADVQQNYPANGAARTPGSRTR